MARTPRAAPFQITDPERIPAQRYYDEEFYQLEKERLWPHVWQMACRIEQLPEVGDWIEYKNLDKMVIIVRTSDGIKAFHNSCRHRGVPITQGGHGNCKREGFICPFHGWRWNIEGKSTFVYGRHMFNEQQLDPDDLALKPCRIELSMGCVFINFDDDASGLRESLGPLAVGLDVYDADTMRAEWCYATVLPANWKTCMEAFMEDYHVMRTHPQLQKTVAILPNSVDTGGEQGEAIPDLSKIAAGTPVNAVEFIFPNYFLLPFLSGMAAYRIRPLGPESCVFELWSLTHFEEGEEAPLVMEPTMLPYDSKDFPKIPQQDYSNIPLQQIGLHAEGFEFMRLSKDIEGLISNYQRLIDGYLVGAEPEKLSKAMSQLAGNLDGPIENLGF
jgi:nitrite reductase/ring-hydroxylating ferredoxin subunit